MFDNSSRTGLLTRVLRYWTDFLQINFKEFSLKVLTKNAAALIAAALSVVSCNTGAFPNSGGGQETPQQKQTKPTSRLPQRLLPSPKQSKKSKVRLPCPSKGGAISWTSSNSCVISNNGNVAHPEGSGVTEVTLTAVLTKGESKAPRPFTVSVHQKDCVPTAEEILQSVEISFTYYETK